MLRTKTWWCAEGGGSFERLEDTITFSQVVRGLESSQLAAGRGEDGEDGEDTHQTLTPDEN